MGTRSVERGEHLGRPTVSPCCPWLLPRAGQQGEGLVLLVGLQGHSCKGTGVCAGSAAHPTVPRAVPLPEHPQGWLPGPPATTAKWQISIKKETFPKTPVQGGGRAPPCAPSLLLPALPGGPWQQSGGHRHRGGTGGVGESGRESSTTPGQCWLARPPWCSVLGLAAILQLWLREGAGCGCAGVRGCAQAGGIISSYYSTSQSKCFLKASIH